MKHKKSLCIYIMTLKYYDLLKSVYKIQTIQRVDKNLD